MDTINSPVQIPQAALRRTTDLVPGIPGACVTHTFAGHVASITHVHVHILTIIDLQGQYHLTGNEYYW